MSITRKLFLIKSKQNTEICFAYNIDIIMVIKKCGAMFNRLNKRWYISTVQLDDLIKEMDDKVEIIIEEVIDDKPILGDITNYETKKIKYDNKENYKPTFIETDDEEALKITVDGDNIRVKLNVSKKIFSELNKLDCERDYKANELIIKGSQNFFKFCNQKNLKYIFY